MNEQQTTLDGFTETAPPEKKGRKPKADAPRPSAADEAQIISYRHRDNRKNNPEVGVVNTTAPASPKTTEPSRSPSSPEATARWR